MEKVNHNRLIVQAAQGIFKGRGLFRKGQALQKVLEYRRFQDLEHTRNKILARNGFSSAFQELYQKMMICGLDRTADHTVNRDAGPLPRLY